MDTCRGESKIFSRGEGQIFKIISKNFDLFFDQIDFPSSRKALKRRCFWPTLKNRSKKSLLGIFWKIWTKKLHFLARAPPLKVSIYWRLKKNFRAGRPKLDFLKSTKGGPFWSAGGRIPEGVKASAPPKSAPGYLYGIWTLLLSFVSVRHALPKPYHLKSI